MRMRRGISLFIFSVAFLTYIIGYATASTSVKEKPMSSGFPEGYQDWTNTCSKTVLDKTSPFYGFQRVLVSNTALSAYKNGRGYPEGSRLVLEFNEPILEGSGDVVKGKTNWIAVMRKDSSATKTGGWVFAAYDGKTKAVKADIDPVKGCYDCHSAKKDRSYVFSEYPK